MAGCKQRAKYAGKFVEFLMQRSDNVSKLAPVKQHRTTAQVWLPADANTTVERRHLTKRCRYLLSVAQRPLPPRSGTAARLPVKPHESPRRREGVCPRERNNNDDNSVGSFIPTLLQPQLVRFMGSVEICSYLVYVFTFLSPFDPLSVFIRPRHRRSFLLTFCSAVRQTLVLQPDLSPITTLHCFPISLISVSNALENQKCWLKKECVF